MSEEHRDAWADNIRGKVEEIREACSDLITMEASTGEPVGALREKLLNKAYDQVSALSVMFHKDNIPPQIPRIREVLHQFRHARGYSNLNKLIACMDSLREIAKSQSSYISFHDIFESYKNDAELNELIDQLIRSIERIIEEGEEHLNSRLEKDLKRLLEQIKGAKKASLYELGAWAEVTARIMLEIAGQKLDLPVTSLLVDAAKIAYKVKQNLASKYQSGESELVRLIEVRSVGTDFSALPEPNPESFRIIDSKVASSSETPHPPESGSAEPPSP